MVNSSPKPYGNLYLIPAPLGDTGLDTTLIDFNQSIIFQIDTFIVEELRTARRFLRKAGYTRNFETVTFHLLNEHTDPGEAQQMLQEARSGKNVGLISEAGLPCIADPGNIVVMHAHSLGIRVVPLVGASSVLLALVASGLNGQNFVFHGYLPVKPDERMKKLREIETDAFRKNQTQIFIETPYRNMAIFESIIKICRPSLMLSIAADLTLESEWIRTMPVSAWQNQKPPIHKRPVVFVLGFA